MLQCGDLPGALLPAVPPPIAMLLSGGLRVIQILGVQHRGVRVLEVQTSSVPEARIPVVPNIKVLVPEAQIPGVRMQGVPLRVVQIREVQIPNVHPRGALIPEVLIPEVQIPGDLIPGGPPREVRARGFRMPQNQEGFRSGPGRIGARDHGTLRKSPHSGSDPQVPPKHRARNPERSDSTGTLPMPGFVPEGRQTPILRRVV